MTTPNLGALEALIAAAKQTVATREAAKKAETKVKAARSNPERTAAQAEADALRALIDWKDAALVYVSEHWQCRCGNDGWNPHGVFILQEHARLANSVRLIRPQAGAPLPDGLPRRKRHESRAVEICDGCADEAGYSRPYVLPMPTAAQAILAFKGPYSRDWDNALKTGHSALNPQPATPADEPDEGEENDNGL